MIFYNKNNYSRKNHRIVESSDYSVICKIFGGELIVQEI